VEVSALNTPERGFFLLSNRAAAPQKVRLTTALPVKSLSRVTADGLQPLRREGLGWRISLRPQECAVLEWK
jgi:hypothetical protein